MTTTSTTLPVPSVPLTIGSIDAYVQAVNQVPMLSAEEERALGRRLRDHGDLEAARRMVLAHLRFVVRVARGYKGYGLALPDLIQEGNIGLMKAVKRFDPEMEVRLVSFAVHWIRAEIHEFILRNWRIVKVATTKAQRKLFFNLRGAKKRLGWFSQKEVDAVARDLGIDPKTVREMESRLSGQDIAFESHSDADSESDRITTAPADYLRDTSAEPAAQLEQEDWDTHNNQALLQALDGLDERSRQILRDRWLTDKKSTLEELGQRYRVSAERIRQIEKSAIKKMRSALS